jgi:hypothetical protein
MNARKRWEKTKKADERERERKGVYITEERERKREFD